MLAQLKEKLQLFKINAFEFLAAKFGIHNHYKSAIKQALAEIRKLQADVVKLDRSTALDVRSSLDLINFDALGDIVWIKVSDSRMVRHDTFNQIRDYMKSKGKGTGILIVTGNNVELKSLTEEDLQKVGLKKMLPNERQ